MALLNPPGILPNVARAIYRYLLEAKGQEEEASRLEAMIAPASLFTSAEAPDPKKVTAGRKRAYEPTLGAMRDLGLLTVDDGQIALRSSLPKEARDAEGGDQAFAATMRTLILDPSVNEGEWGSQEGARDLTLGLAWFLQQSVLDPPGTWEDRVDREGAQQAQSRQLSDRIIRNEERWGPFSRWSRFLGFCWPTSIAGGTVLVPDPTLAIGEALPVIFGNVGSELPARSFQQRLSTELPVLDQGRYAEEMRKQLKPGHLERATDELSPALSHALITLEEQGPLQLQDKADADKLSLHPQIGGGRLFSHVELRVRKGSS